MAKLKYRKEITWEVGLVEAVDPAGKLRVAVALTTPQFRLFAEWHEYVPRPARIRGAVHTVDSVLGNTPWFAVPAIIRCPEAELAEALRRLVPRGTSVKSGRPTRTIRRAVTAFEHYAATRTRQVEFGWRVVRLPTYV